MECLGYQTINGVHSPPFRPPFCDSVANSWVNRTSEGAGRPGCQYPWPGTWGTNYYLLPSALGKTTKCNVTHLVFAKVHCPQSAWQTIAVVDGRKCFLAHLLMVVLRENIWPITINQQSAVGPFKQAASTMWIMTFLGATLPNTSYWV